MSGSPPHRKPVPPVSGGSERTVNPNLLPRYLLCAYTLRWTFHTCSISIPCCLFFFRYAKCLETNTIHTSQRDGLIFRRLVPPDKHGIICYLCCRNRSWPWSEEARCSLRWGAAAPPLPSWWIAAPILWADRTDPVKSLQRSNSKVNPTQSPYV